MSRPAARVDCDGCGAPKPIGKGYRYCTPCARKRQRDVYKRYELKRRYGITRDDVDQLLAAQSNACAICHSLITMHTGTMGLVVDHDHESGAVRGLLCGKCNLVIGHARENVTVLMRASEYVKRHLACPQA